MMSNRPDTDYCYQDASGSYYRKTHKDENCRECDDFIAYDSQAIIVKGERFCYRCADTCEVCGEFMDDASATKEGFGPQVVVHTIIGRMRGHATCMGCDHLSDLSRGTFDWDDIADFDREQIMAVIECQ